MRRAVLFMLALILVGCGTPSTAPEATTQTPYVFSTTIPIATVAINTAPVPLTVAGLSSILFQQPGDLTSEWKLDGETFTDPPVDYDGPPLRMALMQQIKQDSGTLGGGIVWLYLADSPAGAQSVYASRVNLIKRTADKGAIEQTPALGDEAFLSPGQGKVFILNRLVWRRCSAVAEITLGTIIDVDMLTTYARRLDRRLQSSVCQE